MTALLVVCFLVNTLVNASEAWPGVAVIRLAPSCKVDLPEEGAQQFGIQNIDKMLEKIGVAKVEVKFWGARLPEKGQTDITRYYNVYFPKELPVRDVCRDLKSVDGVENAEPWYVSKIILDHNDPQRQSQYGLDLCQANLAHDIATGDRTVPVAIVDLGVELQHQDLVDNIWINPGEDIDGDGVITEQDRNSVDDDRNGYRDDFYGWDFVGRDNNPDDENDDFHGTHCAGIASASTNNRLGISSVGYTCGIMAVRCGSGGQVQFGYEGIRYATDAGARVISCSWGGAGDADFAHDVIRYARDHGAIVLAAAGNDGSNAMIYPGSYEELTCITATDDQDRKADFSNYGEWVDISAPGVNILSTIPGNRYEYLSGTSMATPFAAGVAVLLCAKYPAMSRAEIEEILLNGADDISDQNRQYDGMIGSGRINAYRSLMLGNRPMLSITDLRVASDGDNNGRLDPSEEASFIVGVKNGDHGVATEGISVILTTEDADLTVNHGEVQLPDLEPGQSTNNFDEPFRVAAGETQARSTWVMVTVVADPGQAHVTRIFELVIGHPDVLLIDDDDGAETDSTYCHMIERAGHGWERWDVATKNSPESDELSNHNMVVWSTGSSSPTLDEVDRWQIQNGLLEGAHIVLIGNRIGDDPDNQELLYNCFGAQHELDSVQVYTVEGIGGDKLMPRNMQIQIVNESRRSPSTMSLVNGADSLLEYHMGASDRGLAAVYMEDTTTHSKTAYLGFSLETASDSRTPRSQFLSRLYDWFVGAAPNIAPADSKEIPQILSLSPAFPNPFNSMTAFQFSVPSLAPYRLTLCDPTGREVALLRVGEKAVGVQSVYWDASGMPTGVYFARLSTSGTGTVTQRLILVK